MQKDIITNIYDVANNQLSFPNTLSTKYFNVIMQNWCEKMSNVFR